MLRPSPLVDQATEHLRTRIAAGDWPVGSRLPGETTLAEMLGVGRSTVREAIRALAGAGLVQARHGAGVFVLATEAPLDWPGRMARAALADVYEVRMLLEVQAARLAAERRTDADVTALVEALRKRRDAATADNAQFVDADIALHTAVVTAAHNPVLSDLFEQFGPVLRQALIELVALLGLRTTDPNPGDATHSGLVDAIRAGDPDAATDVLRSELELTLRHLRSPQG